MLQYLLQGVFYRLLVEYNKLLIFVYQSHKLLQLQSFDWLLNPGLFHRNRPYLRNTAMHCVPENAPGTTIIHNCHII